MSERDRGYKKMLANSAYRVFHKAHGAVEANIQLSAIVIHAPSPGCFRVFLWPFPSSLHIILDSLDNFFLPAPVTPYPAAHTPSIPLNLYPYNECQSSLISVSPNLPPSLSHP